MSLFPGVPQIRSENTPFTALTLTQKTKSDMSTWSAQVEMEREELTTAVGQRVRISFLSYVHELYL